MSDPERRPASSATFVEWWQSVGHTLEQASPRETIRPPALGDASFPVRSRGPGDPAVEALGAVLGEGGSGRVTEGTQVSLGRRVAVKEPRVDRLTPGTIHALMAEAWVTGWLEHPNIVPVYDIAETADGRPQILMKQIAGTHWGALLADPEAVRTRFGATDVLVWHLQVFLQVCNAVHYAHSRGLIHRDIKPENVMVGSFGEVYLLDWGLAAAVDDTLPSFLPRASAVRNLAGTPRYMAPEMLPGTSSGLSARTDVYLLGGVLHEIFLGRPPHEGEELEAILLGISGFVLAEDPRVPDGLRPLLRSALSADPTARPQSAEQVRQQVQRYLETRGAEAIASEARAEIAAVHRVLEAPTPTREEAYQHLAAARFGVARTAEIHEASDALCAELDAATSALARWELSEDRPGAAEVLGQGLRTPDLELEEGIRLLRQTRARDKDRLEALKLDRSIRVGMRTRVFVTALALLAFVGHPLAAMAAPQVMMTYTTHFVESASFFLSFLGIGYWARDSLRLTSMNRRSFEILVLLPVVQSVSDLSAFFMGASAEEAFLLRMPVWTTLVAVFALFVEWRIAPAAVVLAVLTVAAAWQPAYTLPFVALASLSLAVNLGVRWGPVYATAIDARTLGSPTERG